MTALLETSGVVKRFGGLHAVDDVSISLEKGAILGLIGPNGSGKTTLLSVLAGTQSPNAGVVMLNGEQVSGKGARATVRAGIGRTFQTTRLFPTWTLGRSIRLASRERRSDSTAEMSDADILSLLGLSEVVHRPCASLSSALQRLAMIAAALSTGPQVLLLDEPAVGMDTDEAAALGQAIQRVRTELDLGVIVVDHNMHFLMPLADTVTVMASGKVLTSGTPAQVRADEAVIASYLGS